MSALTHSPGFFDFLNPIARILTPIASVVAPFFPPAAIVAGVSGLVEQATSPHPTAALVTGPAQSVGTTFPSMSIAADAPEMVDEDFEDVGTSEPWMAEEGDEEE